MNLIKNLFAALIIVASLSMIACQGDTDDARAKSRESLATSTDGTVAPTTSATPTADPGTVTAENQVPTGPTTTMVFEQTDFGSRRRPAKLRLYRLLSPRSIRARSEKGEGRCWDEGFR